MFISYIHIIQERVVPGFAKHENTCLCEQVVVVGAPVTLSGSASTDPNGDTLTYQWSLTTRPNLSAAALTNPNTVGPTFTPDLAGFYVATLTVNDSKGGTHVSRVLIKAE